MSGASGWTFQPDPRGSAGLTIQERFEAFHQRNPWVFDELARLCREMLATGRTRLGLRMFIEVIRWHYYRQTSDETTVFRINDHYISRYVRRLTTVYPELAPCFETRRLRAA